jgi:hypothetical protein
MTAIPTKLTPFDHQRAIERALESQRRDVLRNEQSKQQALLDKCSRSFLKASTEVLGL